jgi:hypothetical protein
VSHRTIEEMSSGGFFADLEPRDATAPVEGLSEFSILTERAETWV